jgi:cytosine/adenosine deaminase-related metal-dependent hydrolase
VIIRARILLPIGQPPLEDGAVTIVKNRIVTVGRWSELTAPNSALVVDLGDSVVLPGLINAHCHLDYTNMAGQILPPKNFTDWIKAMVALKAAWSYTEFAASWLDGAQMLLRHGVTTVADIEAIPELIPDLWNSTPLRVISFRELINLKQEAAVETVDAAVAQWSALPDSHLRAGLSPHAPYSTTAALLQRAAQRARERRWPLTTHVAESEQEFQMFMYRQGPMADWLKGQRDLSDCGKCSPVQYLERCGYLTPYLLAVHVNHLWRDDAALLGKRGVSVAHCPRSHAYFRHLMFPLDELRRARVNLCLGTDSLASVLKSRRRPIELSLFAEMQAMAAKAPDLTPHEILKMATVNGARALGREGELGELRPRALADMIALPFAGKVNEVYEAVIHHSTAVTASLIDGRWALAPPQV